MLISDKRRRAVEYRMIIPPKVDCIRSGSAVYDLKRQLTYFEVDRSKVGKHKFFKIKGFPHFISTFKLNRIDFALECVKLENYLNYEIKRDLDYHERLIGSKITAAVKEYERAVDATGNPSYKYKLRELCNVPKLRKAIAVGLANIFGSFQGNGFSTENLAKRFLLWQLSFQDGILELAEPSRGHFAQYQLELPELRSVTDYLATLPEQLQKTAQICVYETFMAAIITECKIFDKYEPIHGNARFRLYLVEAGVPSVNPPLIYDFKCAFQREVEASANLRRFDLSNRDLREFDFAGKDLTGVRIKGSNLRRARFNGCILNKAEFEGCNLTGTIFAKAKLSEARFGANQFDRTNFAEADLTRAVFSDCDLFHTGFYKANLTEARIIGSDLLYPFFYKTCLFKASFKISDNIRRGVFRQCNFKNTELDGGYLEESDFRNSDLSESRIGVKRILKTNFTKAKFNGADFKGCRSMMECDLRFSSLTGANLTEVRIEKSDLSFVDLSLLKIRQGTAFIGNKMIATNLSRYDFREAEFAENELRLTNLSGAHLEEVDFSSAIVDFPIMDGAFLQDAYFDEEQLELVKLSVKQRDEIVILDEFDHDETEDDELTDIDNDEWEYSDDVEEDY